MKKILSISIAAYNAEHDLKRCLDSLVNSKVVDELEIIVVNDGSKDKTLEIANNYKKQYPKSIIVIDKENGGHGSTINSSIKVASAKYYKTLDSDDWFNTSNLEKMVHYLKESDVDLIINPHEEVNFSTNKKDKKDMIINKKNINYSKVYNFDDILSDITLAMADMTFKTDILKSMNYTIDENCFYVDVEYIIYPLKNVKNIVFFDYVVYEYLVGQANQSTNLKKMHERHDQHLRVIENLICYLKSESLSEQKEALIIDRISRMIFIQYYLYLTMDNRFGKKELIGFDEKVDSYGYNLYDNVIKYGKKYSPNYTRILIFLKKHNYMFYYSIMFTMNCLRRIKRGY